MAGDGIKCSKNERLRERFFMLSSEMQEKLESFYLEMEMAKANDDEKQKHLLSKYATEIFNLVNCKEKDYYGTE